MRTWIVAVAALALTGMMACVPTSGQEQTARIVVAIIGNDIASNDILFTYTGAMELSEIESLGNTYPTDMVPYSELIPKLPSPPNGWTADEPTGMNIDMMGMKYSFGQTTYHKTGAEDEVSVMIWDTVNQESGPWYGYWYGVYSYDTPDSYARTTQVKGYPAWEFRDKKGNNGYLGIGVVKAAVIPELGNPVWIIATLLSTAVAARKLYA